MADTGVGITAEELPHVFERFYRGTQVSEERATGSGLGLSIVHSIVDMHGGRVTVESQPGRGHARWRSTCRGRWRNLHRADGRG